MSNRRLPAHAYEYVGRHRKPEPEPEGPITDVIRATYALFTHPPLHQHNKKEDNR
jgi:hypothetical protein